MTAEDSGRAHKFHGDFVDSQCFHSLGLDLLSHALSTSHYFEFDPIHSLTKWDSYAYPFRKQNTTRLVVQVPVKNNSWCWARILPTTFHLSRTLLARHSGCKTTSVPKYASLIPASCGRPVLQPLWVSILKGWPWWLQRPVSRTEFPNDNVSVLLLSTHFTMNCHGVFPIIYRGSNRCLHSDTLEACVISNCHETHGQGKLRIWLADSSLSAK